MKTKVLSQELIAFIESSLEFGNLQDTVSVISRALGDIEKAPLNTAVMGETGAGKSSLINALQGVEADEGGVCSYLFPSREILERKWSSHLCAQEWRICWEIPLSPQAVHRRLWSAWLSGANGDQRLSLLIFKSPLKGINGRFYSRVVQFFVRNLWIKH